MQCNDKFWALTKPPKTQNVANMYCKRVPFFHQWIKNMLFILCYLVFQRDKLVKSDCTYKRRSTKSNTNPVGSADSLVVDAVAFLRQQGGVPVAVVGLVVAHGERLWRVEARSRELSSEVVLWVQERGVLEVDGNRVAAQDLRRAPHSARSLLLHHHLVCTANTGHKQKSVSAFKQAGPPLANGACWLAELLKLDFPRMMVLSLGLSGGQRIFVVEWTDEGPSLGCTSCIDFWHFWKGFKLLQRVNLL